MVNVLFELFNTSVFYDYNEKSKACVLHERHVGIFKCTRNITKQSTWISFFIKNTKNGQKKPRISLEDRGRAVSLIHADTPIRNNMLFYFLIIL